MTEEPIKLMKDYIRDAITQNPTADNDAIKTIVETLSGKTVTMTYIKRERSRIERETARTTEPPTIEVTVPTPIAPEAPEGVETPPAPLELPPRAEEPSLGEKPELEGLPLAKGFEIKQIGNMFAIPFRIAASRTGFKGFELTTEERNDLAEAWTPVLNEYLPEALAKYGAVVYAGYVTITVVGTKHLDYTDWKKLQKAKKESP